jgi:hypothetical protein
VVKLEELNLDKPCHVNSRSALDEFRLFNNNTQRVGKTLHSLFHYFAKC